MGLNHSKEHHQHKRNKKHPARPSTRSRECSNNSIQYVASMNTTPNLSRSSSTINSRAASMMGDVKDSFHKILGRPTDSPNRVIPRRSFSAPAELFDVDDQKKHCPLKMDEEEQDRLTNTHFVLKHCFGDNFAAPVHDLLFRSLLTPCLTRKNSLRSFVSTNSSARKISATQVLDVACGSGVWVMEMATNYPNSEIHGIDIAPVFPNTIKPSNTFFQQCDMLDPAGFPYPDEYFDYIHMRLVYNCFSTSDLKFVLSEMNRVLKPGGYIEIRDIDPIIKKAGPVTEQIFSDFEASMYKQHSIDVTWTKCIGEILKNEAELTDVHYQEVTIGFGGTESLSSVKCSFLDTLNGYKDYLMAAYSMDSNEIDEKIEVIKKECSVHQSYFSYYMAWGRKPLTPEKLMKMPESIHTPFIQVEPSILENAYDIVHLTQGFTE